MPIEPSLPGERLPSRYLYSLAYAVVHASALYAFLTFALATNGLQFFYFYPREAQTILQPFTLHAMVWLGTAVFSVLGLIAFAYRARSTRGGVIRWSLLAAILGASVVLTVLAVLSLPELVPFWWIGTAAVGICWLGFGSGITRIIGDRRQLLKAFFASLLGIGAIVEIWSIGHWLYAAVAPSTTLGKVGADLEMNITYANSWSFLGIFSATWLSPIWIYIGFQVFRKAKGNKPTVFTGPDRLTTRRLRLGLEDLTLALAIALICVFVGFYVYLHDPPWLVGTDAYWRYKDPLERVTGSDNVLGAAANERHGLYLLILYGVHLVTGLSPFNIVKASPVVLAGSLSIVTYLGVASFRGSRTEGFLAALLSATTFPTTLGIFASIHANWFALSAALVTLFILISLGSSSQNIWPKLILAAFSGTLVLLLHPWTWGILALSALLAGLVFLVRRNWRMFGASWVVPLSGLVLGAFIFTAGSETERARLTETIGTFSAPLVNQSLVLSPFELIDNALRIWAPFLNPLLMILTVIGVLFLVREKSSSYKVFLLSWMVVAGAGTFFAVALETEIWRIWYLQPLWLLGPVGVSGLLGMQNHFEHASTSNFEAVKVAGITFAAGLAVFLLQPILGGTIFYPAALSPILFSLGKRRPNADTILAATLVLFVFVFFLNHALRSLYPLILEPHNFHEH